MDTKEQILEIATELVQTRGYSAFSYQDLSERLGITKASIHHHFRTKEDLGNAVAEKYIADTKAVLSKAKDKSDDPRVQLDVFLQLVLDVIKTRDRVCAASSMQSEINIVPEAMGQSMCSLAHHIVAWISQVIADGRDQGVMDFPGLPDDQAALIYSSTQGAMQYGRTRGPDKARQVIKQIEEIMKPKK